MPNLVTADNQPISSRFGEAIWLTDLITPTNPDIMLKYQELTKGLESAEDRIIALWRYVANLPYRATVKSRLTVNGRSIGQSDTWFYPAETIQVRFSNCANRSFLLTSLVKNELLSPGDVHCVLGYINLDNIGAHGWVELNLSGSSYILETTQPNLERVFIPVSLVTVYDPVIYFDENRVYTLGNGVDIAKVINARFGLCAIHYLRDYLCERCLPLEV